MYEELIAVLRHCGNENVPCEGCPIYDECGSFDMGASRNLIDAANAIDELQQQVTALRRILAWAGESPKEET